MNTINIFAIESSCDDTSAAVLQNSKVLANIIANQKVHEAFGGVVPELASRAHQQNIIPVVDQALHQANINKNQLHAVAYTGGPGLLGSLLVGSSFAKSFAMALNIPLINVDHMQAHIMALFIQENENTRVPEFPFLCLTVSGGHTQISLVKDYFTFEIIGKTLDDAAGEAFDKAAKILSLPYPGGPNMDKLSKEGDLNKFKFNMPVIADLNFSFSGLKTSFLYFLRDQLKVNPEFMNENMNDLCASFSNAVVTVLIDKLKKAANVTGVKSIAIAGGVSANSLLRERIIALEHQEGYKIFIPKFEYCTDNAAMVGITGYYKYINNNFGDATQTPYTRQK